MRKSQKSKKKDLFTKKIAWQGWEIPAMDDWRPLEIFGDYKRGKMMIGNAVAPLLQVKWWRPEEKEFYPEEWIRARIREFKTTPSLNPPRPIGFSNSGWIHELEFKEEVTKTIWYGFDPKASVMMEIVMTSITDKSLQVKIITEIIPRLKVYSNEEKVYWTLYDVAFWVPPGYILRKKHLYSGDVALEFINEKKDTLVLRQVYPAELALSRRSMTQWLDHPAFKTKRRFYLEELNKWESGKINFVDGLNRLGKKLIPFPFKWLFPQFHQAFIALDKDLDRLLIAESITTDEQSSGKALSEYVRMMNSYVAGL